MEKTQKRLGKAEQKYKRFIPESSPVSCILASRSLLLSMDSNKLMALLCSKLRRYYSPLWCLRTTHSHHQWPGSGFLNPGLYSNLFALWASISSSCSSHSPYFLPLDHCGPETSVWWTAVDKRSSPTWATFSLKDTTTSWMQKSQILPIKSFFYTLFKQLSASVTAGFAPRPTHRATHMDMCVHQAWDHCSDMLLVQSTAKEIFWIGLYLWFSALLLCWMTLLPSGEVAFEKRRALTSTNEKNTGYSFLLGAQQCSEAVTHSYAEQLPSSIWVCQKLPPEIRELSLTSLIPYCPSCSCLVPGL